MKKNGDRRGWIKILKKKFLYKGFGFLNYIFMIEFS